MKKMKQLILIFAFTTALFVSVNAQTNFEVPKSVELKTKDDYKKYEKDIINAAKWLEETDLNKETEKRQDVNAFVLVWISGSPSVDVEINDKLTKLYGKNTQLLGMYLAAYSRSILENKAASSRFDATKAGLTSIMTVYKKGIDISKSKEMEKLIKLTAENKLDEYVKSNFNTN